MSQLNVSRRAFIRGGMALSLAPAWFPGPAAAAFDPNFGDAVDAARAIRAGRISSRELTEYCFARIARLNPAINAFVTLNEEAALLRARAADEALARGAPWGALHGVPIVMKDLRMTAGLRTTFGSKRYENFVPSDNDVVMQRLLDAGVVLLGKTNTPEFGADHQTFNAVAGTTNNPWDFSRSPGGSTGGGAAALACGLGFLELGNDLGGSVRNPAHFCGVYGHKPSFDLVPRDGPRLPDAVLATPDNQWVNGPLARSARDLQFALDLVAGPAGDTALAYRLAAPKPRATRLKDFRLGFVLSDPFCPTSAEVRVLLERLIERLGSAGVALQKGWPAGFDLQETSDNWFFLAVNSWFARDEDIRKRVDSLREVDDYYVRKIVEALPASYHQWRLRDGGRLKARSMWQDYFRDVDAFLMPVQFCAAFPHVQNKNVWERFIPTPEGPRMYLEIGRWGSVAIYSGLPASVAPIGRTGGGLPVGVQILGPFLEDSTAIQVAALLEDVVGGFAPPPSAQ